MALQAVSFSDAAKERIRAAADFERKLRLESLLLLPAQIEPFELMPLTLRQFLELEFAENRIIEKVPYVDDLVHLLWLVRPKSEKRSIKSFARFVSKSLTPVRRNEIIAWFNVQFNDMPQGGGNGHVNEYDSGGLALHADRYNRQRIRVEYGQHIGHADGIRFSIISAHIKA